MVLAVARRQLTQNEGHPRMSNVPSNETDGVFYSDPFALYARYLQAVHDALVALIHDLGMRGLIDASVYVYPQDADEDTEVADAA